MECRPPRQGALDTGESRYGRLGRRGNPLDFEQLPGRIQGELTLGRVDKIEIFVIPAKAGIYEDVSLGHYWTQNDWIPVQDRNDGVFVHTP